MKLLAVMGIRSRKISTMKDPAEVSKAAVGLEGGGSASSIAEEKDQAEEMTPRGHTICCKEFVFLGPRRQFCPLSAVFVLQTLKTWFPRIEWFHHNQTGCSCRLACASAPGVNSIVSAYAREWTAKFQMKTNFATPHFQRMGKVEVEGWSQFLRSF